MVSAIDVANFMVEQSLRSGKQLFDVFRLNKALYVAQGVHLAKKGRPLFREKIEAWDHGPVINAVYAAFKQKSPRGSITSTVNPMLGGKLSCEDVTSIFDALSFYNLLENNEVYDFVHASGSPWQECFKPGLRHVEIPNGLIKEYFLFDLEAETHSERLFKRIPLGERVREFELDTFTVEED